MHRAEELQNLLDLIAEQINELVFVYPEISAIELFEISYKNAVEILNQITPKQPLPLKKPHMPVGRVDTTRMAFSLQDNETAAVILGDFEFADSMELDYVGGDDPT